MSNVSDRHRKVIIKENANRFYNGFMFMALKKKKQEDQHFKSVLMAHFILVLHIILIVGMVFLVIFFRGIIHYMAWIFLGGLAAIIASGYHFYNRIKKEGKTVRDMLNSSRYRDRTVEINFMGGLASFKIGGPDKHSIPVGDAIGQFPRLEDSDSVRVREISELVNMLENDLITLDEYNKIKEQIFKT